MPETLFLGENPGKIEGFSFQGLFTVNTDSGDSSSRSCIDVAA